MMSGACVDDLWSLQKSLAGPIYLNTEIKFAVSVRFCTAVIKYTMYFCLQFPVTVHDSGKSRHKLK